MQIAFIHHDVAYEMILYNSYRIVSTFPVTI